DFGGLYFSYVGVADHEFDLYAFFREFQDNSFLSEGGVAGDLVDHTLGARFKGKQMGFDYSAEAMSQTGRQSRDRIQAYAYVATRGNPFAPAWKPRTGVEHDYASGDRHFGDGKRNTFDPLFPFNHYYQGFADIIGWRNLKDLSGYLSVKPADDVSVNFDWHA